VKSCVEQRSYPAANGSAGVSRKYSYQTEYDLEGRLIETRAQNADGSEWVQRNVYDDSGRLLKTVSGSESGSFAETVYSYDDHGKLLRITNSGSPENPIAFSYDEAGRKTKVQISRSADYRPNVAIAGSPFEAGNASPNLPGGGTTTTIYDDLDRPIEIQTRDSHGELVSRALRSYDHDGHVLDEKQILTSPEMLIPAELRTKVLERSGASIEELRQELTRVMGGQAGPTSEHYTYDKNGQIKQTVRRIFNQEETIEATYNGQGDKEKEITRTKQVGGDTENGTAPARQPYSEVRYSYDYDTHGNWTRQTISYRDSEDGTFQQSTETRREISYY
jgi:YD repeat-containing protein